MKQRLVAFLSILFLVLLVSLSASAQNYSSVKVDELSDTQIRQMIQRAESVGYSEAQLEQMAAAQGMRPEEIQKLKIRVEKLKKQTATNSNDTDSETSTEDNSRKYTDSKADSLRRKREDNRIDIFEALKPKIFGADLFKNSNITFEPNVRLATPRGYIIGPDDELLVDISGDNEANYKLKVSPDGTIRLQYVGNVSVAGLSMDQATSKIKSSMSGTYPAIKSGRTTVSVNLGNIRSIKVVLTGNVVKPGTYTLSSLSTAFTALYAAGGPNENGSYRKIQVIRNNKVVSTIDAYDFIAGGIQKGNVRLQDQDVINIPVYETRVEVSGEIKRPALFEVLKGESLQSVLHFAGGFTTQAYTAKIKVFQNTDKERKLTDVAAAEFGTYQPKNGDRFVIEGILDRFENRVEIVGAVFRPGQYELEKGLTLRGLINKADGLTEDAFLNRGYISRLNPDNTQALISFDVAKIISGADTDISLLREDKITINSLFDLRDEYKITIQGEIRVPGSFDYADNMTLGSVIQMAGGFKEGATPNRIEVSRRVKNSDVTEKSAIAAEVFTIDLNPDLSFKNEAFILKPFDIVTVRSSEGYSTQKQVKLEGEVVYPGIYTITRKDEKISDLIKRAGGLTYYAYPDGASLKRPGAEKINPSDKNAIDTKEEEEKKYLALKRAQEAGVKDTLTKDVEQKLIESDLVGINLEKIIKKPNSKYDLIVEDGDVIRVPRTLQTVKITGEVLNPNSIIYSSGKGLRQYINGAGGFTTNARRNGTYVKYANGSAASVTKFLLFFNNNPQIKPGAEIMVPKRAERERLTAQSWIGIGTAVASLGAIIVSLLR
ncbi:SLBB domain-containing protein [Pedobacter sp. MW01-1-1]|uniref:SLBB domain-containing protein n=1 Tax=Pedobacter sp. MW01-1-1 TaxID=3383027 RepID=UPI003FF0522D